MVNEEVFEVNLAQYDLQIINGQYDLRAILKTEVVQMLECNRESYDACSYSTP